MREIGTSSNSSETPTKSFSVPLNITQGMEKDLALIQAYQEKLTGVMPPLNQVIRGGVELFKRHYEEAFPRPTILDTDLRKNIEISICLPVDLRPFFDEVISNQGYPVLTRNVIIRYAVAWTINQYFKRMEADAN